MLAYMHAGPAQISEFRDFSQGSPYTRNFRSSYNFLAQNKNIFLIENNVLTEIM